MKSPVPESSGNGNQNGACRGKPDAVWTGIFCFLDLDTSAAGLGILSLPFGDLVQFNYFPKQKWTWANTLFFKNLEQQTFETWLVVHHAGNEPGNYRM